MVKQLKLPVRLLDKDRFNRLHCITDDHTREKLERNMPDPSYKKPIDFNAIWVVLPKPDRAKSFSDLIEKEFTIYVSVRKYTLSCGTSGYYLLLEKLIM